MSGETESKSRAAATVRRYSFFLLLSGVLFATYGSLAPFNFQGVDSFSAGRFLRSIPRSLSLQTGRIDFFSNVCLFIPIGFGGLAWLSAGTIRAHRLVSFLVVSILAFVLSVAIESAQLFLPSRVASWIDVAAQILGTFIGSCTWILFGDRIRKWAARMSAAHGGQARLELFLQAYLVLHVCMSLFPLDVTIHPVDLYGKFQRGRVNVIPFVGHDWTADLLLEMVIFGLSCIPLGALAARWGMKTESGVRSIPDSLAIGVLLVIGIEACQLFVLSRFTDATQIVVGAVGVTIGVLLMHTFWPQGTSQSRADESWMASPGTWLLAATLYAFVPAVLLLWPLEFVFDGPAIRESLSQMCELPFVRLLNQSSLSIQTVVLRDFLLFLPLGMLVGAAIRCVRPRWRATTILLGGAGLFVFCAGLEVLQTLVPQRHPDITNVLLGGLAGCLGIAVLTGGRGFSLLEILPTRVSSTKR